MSLDGTEIKECPFCGSTESYSYIVTHKFIQHRGFTSEDYNYPTDLAADHHGACKCDNCGKIIKGRE